MDGGHRRDIAGGLRVRTPKGFGDRAGGAGDALVDRPGPTGLVEGRINRLKTIKRTMYGRAGFELLRSSCPEAWCLRGPLCSSAR
ncbi:hypothetical protein GAY29_01060 [Azospirillum brasilense]|nr:hypothetical protein [Azospirillum brasilense]